MTTHKNKRMRWFFVAAVTFGVVATALWWTLRTESDSTKDADPFAHPGLLKPGELDGLSRQESVKAIQRDAKARLSLYNLAMANRTLKVSGIVVDEDGKPIAGATVGYDSQRLLGPTPVKRVLTNNEGTFQINGEAGVRLDLSAGHEDYLSLPGSRVDVRPFGSLFRKDGDARSGDHVTLVLRRKPPSAGLKPVNARREFESESWVLSFDMGTGRTRVGEPTGPQEIGFYLELGEGAIPFERKFDWKVTLRIPGGGAQIRTDLKSFEAPESGYEESLVVSFDADDYRWAYVMDRNAFVQLPDGTYGRLNYSVSAAQRDLIVSGYHNSTGSRNLFP